ncbi:protein brambleberry [Hippocampus comes]|uniref:Brambleberry n=1 Tax=Hippocampus comes TaxID=109280 RepID=A0A3Q2XQU7_HIPCM|nr:PREDICTED: protein brambleberry-like [Hippocampus comes]
MLVVKRGDVVYKIINYFHQPWTAPRNGSLLIVVLQHQMTDMVHLPSSYNYLLLLCILASSFPAVTGLFEWLRQKEEDPPGGTAAAPSLPPPPPPADSDPSILAVEARFEMATTDEKFLAEAKQMELSPLDSCHHKVVAQLKASCEALSEEELAKLGVLLFNCQAQIEGRQSYPCTEQMAIKECTANMDSDTWNAYHIVSNRARAVCYASRQQLFRRRAVKTVNMLIASAASQLSAMEDLKDGQLALREMTAASLDKLVKGHSALQTQQAKLREGQGQMESSLRDNLQRLGQEKALIASGQELVAKLIQGITDRMALVSENMQIQGSEVQESHRAIVQDLADVRQQAQSIHQKLDDSMSEFLEYQDQTLHYYTDLMGKLERMNSSLGFVLHFLDETQGRIEERLRAIQSYLGWAGLSITAMWTCIVHTSYFVLFAVVQSFLRCPLFSRATLLLTVPLNAVAEVNQQPALDLASLSLLIVTLSLGHWFVSQLWVQFPSRGNPSAALPFITFELAEPQKSHHAYPPSSTPQKKGHGGIERNDPLKQEGATSSDFGIPEGSSHRKPAASSLPRHCASPFLLQRICSGALIDDITSGNPQGAFDPLNYFHDIANDSRSASPTPSVSNSSLSGRPLCNSITKAGTACKKRALFGQDYCRVHEGRLNPSFHS